LQIGGGYHSSSSALLQTISILKENMINMITIDITMPKDHECFPCKLRRTLVAIGVTEAIFTSTLSVLGKKVLAGGIFIYINRKYDQHNNKIIGL
jgi:hypothetical protein